MIHGADVVDYRRRRNLSRKALAEQTGLTEGKIWRIENKDVISDDERDRLRLAGVGVVVVDGEPPRAVPPPAPAPVAVAATYVSDSLVVEQPVPDVDWTAALAAAEVKYDRLVSNSELRTFKRCRRKWWLAWHRGLVAKNESPVGVRQIGDRLHRALKMHYSPTPSGGLMDALEREIAIDRAKLPETVTEDVMLQFVKEADLERIMLEGYLAWLAETGADSELQVIGAETYLEAEIMEGVALIGKIDVRIRRTTDGVHLFLDHKSVGDLKTPTLTLALDEQMLHYHLLEQLTNEDGQRCDGALYNMLKRVKRTQRATPPFYSRVEVRHNKHELENYATRVRGEINDMRVAADQLEFGFPHQQIVYPNPTRDCTWDCPFLAVCPMFDDGSRAEDLLAQYFDVRDPLSYYLEEVLGE